MVSLGTCILAVILAMLFGFTVGVFSTVLTEERNRYTPKHTTNSSNT